VLRRANDDKISSVIIITEKTCLAIMRLLHALCGGMPAK
jgi:hypothetical protein